MGSYSSTRIDTFEIWGSKSEVDADSLSIFQERDRLESNYIDYDQVDGEDDGQRVRYEYVVSSSDMRDRLEALGFTLQCAERDYNANWADYVDRQERYLHEFGMRLSENPEAEIAALKTRSFSWWTAAVAKLIPIGWNIWDRERFAAIPESEAFHLMDGVSSFFSDDRLYLRAMLNALVEAKQVSLDITALVDGGYYHAARPICDEARYVWSETTNVYGPTVILTEGKLDSRVLAAAYEALSPHLADFFGFLDFDGVSLPGSADNLAKLVRAFVGARLSSRMVAVFDNDTAGTEALQSLSRLKLPPNIKAISLPRSDLATAYPTEGPQGPATMDVNGLACSIEMFFGREALTGKDGALIPVRWSGYNAKLHRYQGAVEAKGDVQDAFFKRLGEQPDRQTARSAFPDMARLIDKISFVFAEGQEKER